jgi:glycyl-tRNA synthetase beta chain
MKPEPLLLEIGCEEIPARMIRAAAAELASRLTRILDQAGLDHGAATAWGGTRRLAVRVETVCARQEDREETVTGPPAEVGWSPDGTATDAALGFARKHGIEPARLSRVETERGIYVGFRRRVSGRPIGEILAGELPRAVEGMPFAKAMRWGDGRLRWVRPVHWILALHGTRVVPLVLFRIAAAGHSIGHRFIGQGEVPIEHPDAYPDALERAHVVVDPVERRRRLARALEDGARQLEGCLMPDDELLEEVSYLVEWPGVVEGRFDSRYLDLPEELLTTTLRHHQKCFSVRGADDALRPGFLAVSNTDGDRAGHIRRGNEWVVAGRLEDARFFWNEDRKRPLVERLEALDKVVFHARAGSFRDKAARIEELADRLARRVGLREPEIGHARAAARLAKVDLTTTTVGEFPELQGRIGGLLLAAEGAARPVSGAVYAHYQPVGPDDAIPPTEVGCVVAVADKLDSVARLVAAGELPRGSKDPFGLRRAWTGIFRTVVERQWPVCLADLCELAGEPEGELGALLLRGFENFLRERGWTINEIQAVLKPQVSRTQRFDWPLHDVVGRLEALQQVRGRDDFRNLVKLTQRVHNIISKEQEKIDAIRTRAVNPAGYRETEAAADLLARMVAELGPLMAERSENKAYREVVELISRFIEPVERFFDDVLVVDERNPEATSRRYDLLIELKNLLTRYFDIREMAGQAERSG